MVGAWTQTVSSRSFSFHLCMLTIFPALKAAFHPCNSSKFTPDWFNLSHNYWANHCSLGLQCANWPGPGQVRVLCPSQTSTWKAREASLKEMQGLLPKRGVCGGSCPVGEEAEATPKAQFPASWWSLPSFSFTLQHFVSLGGCQVCNCNFSNANHKAWASRSLCDLEETESPS